MEQIFFAIFRLKMALFWPHFCFWEALKWLHINTNGLKWRFVMTLNSLDQKNYLKSMKRASSSFKLQIFTVFSLNTSLFWPHFCLLEASKWLHINANGLKCKFVMTLNNFDQNCHLESINRACRSFKVQFLKFSVSVWPYFGPILTLWS